MNDGQKIACGFLLLYCGGVVASNIERAVFGSLDAAHLWIYGLCGVPSMLFLDYCHRGRISITSFGLAALLVACLTIHGVLMSPFGIERLGLSAERFLGGLLLVAVSYWVAAFIVRFVFGLAKVNRPQELQEKEKRSTQISENGNDIDNSVE